MYTHTSKYMMCVNASWYHAGDASFMYPGLFTDPLPMRLRALPQSFWQQPNVPHSVSPGASYPTLPPLIIKDSEDEPLTGNTNTY